MAMTTIDISEEAMGMIRSNTLPAHTFRQNGTRLPNGLWRTPIDEDTLERLVGHQLPGENLSDTIIRAISVMRGRH